MDLNRGKKFLTSKKRNLVTFSHPSSIISEQFRTIQTNIKFATTERKCRTFLITSPSKGEGKSTLVANLAVSMALQKEKVLLIDGNLRSPVLHSMFNLPNNFGLSNVLSGLSSLEDSVHRTEIGRLHILTSGPVPINPLEVLSSNMMEELMGKLLQPYDVVLIDSPQLLEVTETKMLARMSDAVVMVINFGKTTIDKAAEAKKILEFGKSRLIGAIVNE